MLPSDEVDAEIHVAIVDRDESEFMRLNRAPALIHFVFGSFHLPEFINGDAASLISTQESRVALSVGCSAHQLQHEEQKCSGLHRRLPRSANTPAPKMPRSVMVRVNCRSSKRSIFCSNSAKQWLTAQPTIRSYSREEAGGTSMELAGERSTRKGGRKPGNGCTKKPAMETNATPREMVSGTR